MELFNLFPTSVAKFKIKKPLSKKQMLTIKNLDYMRNETNLISINKYVLNLEDLKPLKNFVVESVNQYFDQVMRASPLVRPYVTISWTNIATLGQGHHRHTHPNSILSGVFYIETSNEDKIYFCIPQTHREIKFPKPIEYNLSNSETWWLPAEMGVLYLFPSSLTHFVEPVDTERIRISLSFNTFISGSLGDETDATALKLNFDEMPF